jgi:hypothetical protein
MKNAFLTTFLYFLAGIPAANFCMGGGSGLDYGVAESPWEEKYGNHRAIIEVDRAEDAVHIDFLWKRHDRDVENRRFIIVEATSAQEIENIHRVNLSNERCELVFGPVGKSGKYYFYYLPYKVQKGWGFYGGDYLRPEKQADGTWISKHGLDKARVVWKDVGEGKVVKIQARTKFDSFWPMEVSATEEEKAKYFSANSVEYLVFAENRDRPIRMKDEIPQCWLAKSQNAGFTGQACRNEYYCFQIGVYAHRKGLEDVKVEFDDLKDGQGRVIDASLMTCFNTGGIDAYGEAFSKRVDVQQGMVQAFWVGVDIGENVKAGPYEGYVIIRPANAKERKVRIKLNITDKFLQDRGDSEPWRHSRLRWLNSRLGIDDEPVAPYTPIEVEDREIKCLGRSVELSETGLPATVKAWGNSVLSEPIRFVVRERQQSIEFASRQMSFKERKSGKVSWESDADSDAISFKCDGSMEFDGYLHFNIHLQALTDTEIEDTVLEIPLREEIAQYVMGMGLGGGEVPEAHKGKWGGPQDSFWIGNTQGGIHCELRGASYSGPLLNLYRPQPPEAWHNGGKGGFEITRTNGTVFARVYSGKRKLLKGRKITFEFSLLITPVKELDTARQFTERYYHNGGAPDPTMEDVQAGIKIVNVHHANKYNPHINYPFIAGKELKDFVDKWHEKGMKVKIYYTVRELTNYVTEIWALRSLDNEALDGGGGGGYPWLREHFISDYRPQWYQHFEDKSPDASILTSGTSRWYNYYIEGLGWLIRNMDIDGLYLDDVSYDRRILKRMRKVMEMNKSGCIIDLHSNTGFSKGPAIQYTEFFPYIDKLWFGESFQYDNMPAANWLVEVSGIPFGLMGDMLHGGGNRWRGMVYGMTVRHPWQTEGVICDPRPIWKVWDEFGIDKAKMTGYWEADCPIRTDCTDIYATAYVKKDEVLMALGSWADKTVDVKLIVKWDKLEMKPEGTMLVAPEIEGFQEKGEFSLDKKIPVEPARGKILILRKKWLSSKKVGEKVASTASNEAGVFRFEATGIIIKGWNLKRYQPMPFGAAMVLGSHSCVALSPMTVMRLYQNMPEA